MSDRDILVLKGSPSRNSGSLRLAMAIAAAAGGRTRIVDLYDIRPQPCRSCGRCGVELPCPLADAASEAIASLERTDVLLVASPLHFTSLSAPVIAFYSRLQPFWLAARRGKSLLSPRRRLGALALAAGSEYPGMFKAARSVTAAAFNSLPVVFAGVAAAANTDALPAADNEAALDEAAALGRRIRDGLR